MSFNSEQEDEMRWLASQPPESLCYCGWYRIGKCPHCPTGLSNADKLRVRCTSCRNAPPPNNLTGPFTHNVTCRRGS